MLPGMSNPAPAIAAIAERRGLVVEHPEPAQAEARAWLAAPGINDPTLVDLTHLPFITIDEEHSKDLDQALYIEADGTAYRVWYAIADASWYVRPGSALLDEALLRGSTYYLPGLVVPMLPASLSEGLISLNPDVDRRALVFEIALDASGEVTEFKLQRARVRSRAKTWYDAVQAWYDGEAPCPDGPEVARSLELLRRVGELRLARAEHRDVVRFRRAELMVRVDGDNHRFVALSAPRNDCEQYNEQISLLCNAEGARWLAEPSPHVQPIFRTHAPPEGDRTEELAAWIDALVRSRGLESDWRWQRGSRPLRSFLNGLPTRGAAGRVAAAIHRRAMLNGGSADYTRQPAPHFGVGEDAYARFTAPMREIVGVYTHKEAFEKLGAPHARDRDDERLRDRVIASARSARKLQQALDAEVNRIAIDQLLRDDRRRGTERTGTIMGVNRSKVHLLLDDPPIDVKIYLQHLQEQLGERLSADADQVSLVGRDGKVHLTVGDSVTVRAMDFDAETERWRIEVVGLARAQ